MHSFFQQKNRINFIIDIFNNITINIISIASGMPELDAITGLALP